MELTIYYVEIETETEINTAYVAAPDKTAIKVYGRGLLKKMANDVPYNTSYKISAIRSLMPSEVPNLATIIYLKG